jgi:hypothetical protein
MGSLGPITTDVADCDLTDHLSDRDYITDSMYKCYSSSLADQRPVKVGVDGITYAVSHDNFDKAVNALRSSLRNRQE